MKICRVCRVRRRNIEFAKQSKASDGLYPYCKPCSAQYNRQRLYGLTQDEYMGMLRAQEGECAICHDTMVTPHTDHNHQTGKVRGLLCPSCNLAIGKLGDDPNVLISAAAYLVKDLTGGMK